MKFALVAALVSVLLAGCASSAMKPYLGKSATDVAIDWGKPVNQFDTPDGRKVVQYYWGGGTVVMPGNMTATSTSFGNMIYTNARVTPSQVITSEGCLVSFILESQGGDWVVVETRYPDRAFC